MNIALIGLKSCGKSTIGPLLAHSLNYQCVDTDTMIEDYYAQRHSELLSFKQIHQKIGEQAFHHIESLVLEDKLPAFSHTVVCTGGGTLLNQENTILLKTHCKLIYLNVSEQQLLQRWQQSPPGFVDHNNIKQQLHNYYQAREPLMTTAADLTVECTNIPAETICNRIAEQLANYK